ncbi:MAG TPA: MarR family winged helix-turn-helix transcriptional regulator [Burkholderiaceae bacterium]
MNPTAPAPPLSPCSVTALRKASRRVTQLYDTALAPAGLRSTQHAILSELNRRASAPPTLQALADALVMDRSALGHTLRPLERDGLIGLQPGTHDRRQRYVVLTAAGAEKYREARSLWSAAQRRFQRVFGEGEARALRETLLAIANDERLATLED